MKKEPDQATNTVKIRIPDARFPEMSKHVFLSSIQDNIFVELNFKSGTVGIQISDVYHSQLVDLCTDPKSFMEVIPEQDILVQKYLKSDIF